MIRPFSCFDAAIRSADPGGGAPAPVDPDDPVDPVGAPTPQAVASVTAAIATPMPADRRREAVPMRTLPMFYML
jgi:hypothetical protein